METDRDREMGDGGMWIEGGRGGKKGADTVHREIRKMEEKTQSSHF